MAQRVLRPGSRPERLAGGCAPARAAPGPEGPAGTGDAPRQASSSRSSRPPSRSWCRPTTSGSSRTPATASSPQPSAWPASGSSSAAGVSGATCGASGSAPPLQRKGLLARPPAPASSRGARPQVMVVSLIPRLRLHRPDCGRRAGGRHGPGADRGRLLHDHDRQGHPLGHHPGDRLRLRDLLRVRPDYLTARPVGGRVPARW